MFEFPERLTQPQVARLVEFLSHQTDPDGKRMTKLEVKVALAENMSKDDATGKPIDENGYPFDPRQVERRKMGIPAGFCKSAAEYMRKRYDVIDMYFILKNVLGEEIEPYNFLYRAVAEWEFGVRGETLGSIRSMAESLKEVRRILGQEEGTAIQVAYYLIITMINDTDLNIAPMTLELKDDDLALPKFTTRQYLGGEITSEVSGFMMEASSFIYTIGQDFNHSNLRLSKLQLQPRIKADPENPNRYDLVGLRVGGFSGKARPNTHRVFGYQFRDKARMTNATNNIIEKGSARNYRERELSIPQGISEDFDISPALAESIYKFLIAPSESLGHLDTPPFDESL